jgi:hypothetical protein
MEVSQSGLSAGLSSPHERERDRKGEREREMELRIYCLAIER